jgi:hypothetical protein
MQSDHKAIKSLEERVEELETRLEALENHPGIKAIASKPASHWGVEEAVTEPELA